MSDSKKMSLRKGEELFNTDTKEKVVFVRWNDDGTAAFFTPKKTFVNIDNDTLLSSYKSYRQIEKDARERRKGQGW